MLQKGFLKPDEDRENSRTAKNGWRFLMFGMVFAIFAAMYMMAIIGQPEFPATRVTVAGIAMIAGLIMAVIGVWMSFFAQYKNRRK